MSNSFVTVDVKGVKVMFDSLNSKQLVSATRSAFTKSLKIMLQAVKANYDAAFPGSVLSKAIHAKAFRSGKGGIVDLIYVGKHSKGDPLYKSYILKMLNSGTKTRTTSKGYYRGSISGKHFFQSGVSASETAAVNSLQQNIEAAIQKKYEKLSK